MAYRIWTIASMLLLITITTQGSNILFLHPLYSGSHVLTLHKLAAGLLNNNHSVTTLMYRDSELPQLQNKLHPNFTLIELTINNTHGNVPFVPQVVEGEFRLPMELIWQNGNNFIWSWKMILAGAYGLSLEYCTKILSPDLISLLRKSEFDVMVIDLMFNECGLALAQQLGLPTVAYWSTFAPGMQEFTTLPAQPSFVPMFMSGFSDRMNFFERTYNLLNKMLTRVVMNLYQALYVDPIISELAPTCPASSQLLSNLNGMLINTDDVIDYPRAKPPTFINIGGLQIQETSEMSKDLRRFLDSAKYGAILFTMGFIFDSKAVPTSMIENLLEAFSRLPQKVIFKYKLETSSLSIPANVLLLPWVPQQAVLAHKKTLLFITHCGMHGVLEAIHYAVPMVGIPIFIDQGDVLRRMLDKEIAVPLDKAASADQIHAAIVEVRDDPKYQYNINNLSKLSKDKKEHPLVSAVWLVEYIARNNGTNHLRIPSGDLSWIEYHCLDSILLIAAILLVTLATLAYFLIKLKNSVLSLLQTGDPFTKAKEE